jgi:hypothetical protein
MTKAGDELNMGEVKEGSLKKDSKISNLSKWLGYVMIYDGEENHSYLSLTILLWCILSILFFCHIKDKGTG